LEEIFENITLLIVYATVVVASSLLKTAGCGVSFKRGDVKNQGIKKETAVRLLHTLRRGIILEVVTHLQAE
jgi:hypothetical protein